MYDNTKNGVKRLREDGNETLIGSNRILTDMNRMATESRT